MWLKFDGMKKGSWLRGSAVQFQLSFGGFHFITGSYDRPSSSKNIGLPERRNNSEYNIISLRYYLSTLLV